MRNFIAVITHHQRLHELRDMITAYASIADENTGVAEVEITTARPLDDGNRRLLEQQVAKLAGEPRCRPPITRILRCWAALSCELGSTVYDGSVRGQLEQMRQRLATASA